MKKCSLGYCKMICTCGEQNENLVLTTDMLRGKNPMGEKVLSIAALIVLCTFVVLSCESCLEVHVTVPG